MILTLDECVEIAIQNNLGLRLSRISDRGSDLDLRSAWSRFLPSFTASLEHSGGQTGSAHSNTTTLSGSITQEAPWGTSVTLSGRESESHPGGSSGRSSSYGVSVTHPLWKGFGEDVGMYEIRSARLGKLISRGELELSLQETIFLVRSAYANCVRQLQNLEVNRRAVESAETFLRLTQARERAGMQTRLDVYNAEVQLADRQLALTQTQREVENAHDALKRLMDVDLEEPVSVVSEPVDFGEKPAAGEERVIETDEATGAVKLVVRRAGAPQGEPALMFAAQRFDYDQVLKDALANRIELLNGRRRLALDNLTAMLRKDGLGHQIDLELGYERSAGGRNWSESHGFENHDYSVGLKYSVPWGKVSDRTAYEQALLTLEAAEVELKDARTQVHMEVRDNLRALREAEKSILIQAKKVEQAKRLVEAERVRFERGIKDSFDVIRAEDNLLQAKTDFISRKVSYVVRLAQLETVIGKPTGRVDLSAKTDGGQVRSALPDSLRERGMPKPAPEPDKTINDKY